MPYNLFYDTAKNLYLQSSIGVRKVDATTGTITRVAGTTSTCTGYGGTSSRYATVGDIATNDGMYIQASALDPVSGDVYVEDLCTNYILAVNPSTGRIDTEYARGSFGGNYTQSAFDASGNFYFFANQYLDEMSRSGTVTRIAGNGSTSTSGDGGPALNAGFSSAPTGLALSSSGDIYIGDYNGWVIRDINPQGTISTVAGTGSYGSNKDGGPAGSASIEPYRLAFNSRGDLYVSDYGSDCSSTEYYHCQELRVIKAPISTSSVISSVLRAPVAQSAGGETTGGSNPSELNCDQSCSGDPVNTATGEYWTSATDLAIPGRGPAVAFRRTYSSLATAGSALGYGWTNNYAMKLSADPAGDVIVQQENGSQLTFFPNSAGGYSGVAHQLATLTANADGTYTLLRRARQKVIFDSSGRLIKEQDLNGYTSTLAYNASGQLASVTDAAGRALTLSYNASGQLTQVADPTGRAVTYGYDTSGNLASVVDANGHTWSYTYDTGHHLLTTVDPSGHAQVTNTYDGAGRAVTQTDGLGRKTSFSYQLGMTEVTSPAGERTDEYYSSGALSKRVQGVGTAQQATWTYAYDPSTVGVTSVTDPNGNTWKATYDSAGNQTGTTDPLGHSTSARYDALNDRTAATDPNGVTTTSAYDSRGNLQSSSTPLSGTSQSQGWSYSYGDSAHPGDVTAIGDPNGKTTSLGYDASGDLTSVVDPRGDTTTFGYDAVGRRTSRVSPRGNAAGAGPGLFTTAYAYNAANQPISVTDPLGHQTTWSYDAAGNLTSLTDANGHTTNYAYDAANELTQLTRADGSVLKDGYDADGHLSSQTDGAGASTSYSYDPLERLASTTDPLGRAATYGYDASGNLTALTDPAGRSTRYAYDQANRLTSIGYSDGQTPGVSFGYDNDGQRTSMRDGTGSSSYSYDSLHRLTAATNGSAVSVGYGYDLANHLTAVTYPGSRTVARGFDDAGRLTSVRDWLGNTTSFAYDPDSNLTTATFPQVTGDTDSYGYDAADHPTSTSVAQNMTSLASLSYSRDPLGQLTQAIQTGLPGAGSHGYGYSSLNQLTTLDGSTQQTYDAADNPTQLGGVSGFQYDAANELTGAPAGSLGAASAGAWSLGYDKLGQRTSQTPASGSPTTLSYDQAGRLAGVVQPGGPSPTYAYQGDGLRATKTLNGTTTRYLWDQNGQLLSDGATSYLYGPDGTPVEQIDAAGTPTYYHHDQLGSTRLLTNQAGAPTATFTYTPYGTLEAKTGSQTTPLGYAGQYTDPDTGLVYLRARDYDPRTAQFLIRDPLDAATRQAYTYGDDNPLNETDPSGLGALRSISDAVAGFGDTASLGFSKWVRQQLGTDGAVDYCSSAYQAGAGGGTAVGVLVPGEGELDLARVFGRLGEILRDETGAISFGARRSLPKHGLPNSTDVIDRGDYVGQIREYGPDGIARKDFDFGHDHGAGNPHAHDWINGNRQQGRPVRPGE